MSQGVYKIESARVDRTYSDQYGEKQVWLVRLENARAETPSGLFELHKKQDSKPPEPGDTLNVERFIPGDFQGEPFVRIKQVYNQAARGSGDSKSFDRRPEHPRNEARMIHTSALSAAPAYIEQMLTVGALEQPSSEDDYWSLVSRVAGRLARSYEAALRGIEGGQQQVPPPAAGSNGGEVPADASGLVPAPAGVADDVPF